MKLTREQNREKSKKYRAKYPEKMRAYDRARWKAKRGEQARLKHMGDKKCRICEIRLAGKFGGYGTKFYCRSCVDRGLAQRHSVREAMRRLREKRKNEGNNNSI